MRKALIVEDDAIWQQILKEVLEKGGYEVVGVAPNHPDALRLFRKHQSQVVTCDGKLQGEYPGLAVASEIRKIDPSVRIVMVSGDSETIFEGRGVGKRHFDSAELLRLLSE